MDRAQSVKASIARRTHLPLASIRDDTELERLPLDSFALVELLIELEHKHGLRLTAEDLGDLRTVRDLVSRIHPAAKQP